MNWFFIALITPLLHSFSNFIDKFLLSKYFQHYRLPTLIIYSSITAIFLLSLAFYRDWQLSLVICVVSPLFILIFQQSGKKVRYYVADVQESLGEMTHDVQEGLSGQKISKAFNLQTYILNRFKRSQENSRYGGEGTWRS